MENQQVEEREKYRNGVKNHLLLDCLLFDQEHAEHAPDHHAVQKQHHGKADSHAEGKGGPIPVILGVIDHPLGQAIAPQGSGFVPPDHSEEADHAARVDHQNAHQLDPVPPLVLLKKQADQPVAHKFPQIQAGEHADHPHGQPHLRERLVRRVQADILASGKGVAGHHHEQQNRSQAAHHSHHHTGHTHDKVISGAVVLRRLSGIGVVVGIGRVHGHDQVILVVAEGVPHFQIGSHVHRHVGQIALHADGISGDVEIAARGLHLLHRQFRRVGVNLVLSVIAVVGDAEMHIGLVLNIIVVNGIIVAQVIQHVQGQVLPGHPVLLQLPVHEVGVVGLPVHGDLIVVIVHGGGHALDGEILIQVISPGLGVADQLVQGQLLAEPGAVADAHNSPLHVQLSICLKHIPVAHIAEYLLNILLQTG